MTKHLKLGGAYLMLAIGGAAGAITLTLNGKHGWSVAVWLMLVCIVADFARITIPVIASKNGWSRQMKVGITLLGLFSFMNICGYVATQHGPQILAGLRQQDGKALAGGKVAALQSQIDAIKEKRSSASLLKLAESEKSNKFCGPKCTAWVLAADEAQRREALEAKLDEQTKTVETATVVDVQGFGVGFVALGMNPVAAQAINDAIFHGLLPLLIVDFLVYFLIPGMGLLRQGQADAKLEALGVTVTVTKLENPGRKIGKDEALQLVLAKLLETDSNTILTSNRQLCKVILGSDVRKTTFNNWMNEWVANGKLTSVPYKKGRGKGMALIGLPGQAKVA